MIIYTCICLDIYLYVDIHKLHANHKSKTYNKDFPGGAVVKNLPANAGDMGSSPGPGRSHMPQSN